MNRQNEISSCIINALDQYFRDLDGAKPSSIYDMVMNNVERTMLEYVLFKAHGNQTAAASMLGINRNTLRRKLTEFQRQPSSGSR